MAATYGSAHARREHVARRLDMRFQPLFWLARNPPLADPVRTDEAREEVWERLDELARLLDRAGLSGSWAVTARDRAQERKNPDWRKVRLAARWTIPDTDHMRALRKAAERPDSGRPRDAAPQLAWIVNDVRSHYVEGGWVWRRREGVDEDGKPLVEQEQVGLLDALTVADKKWRADFLKWMQVSPVAVDAIKARLVVKGTRVELEPDPRDLHSCIWKLAAELIAGGWPIKRCAAPGCGKYIGQWTKRKRLFCDEGCRTTYHNARRGKARGSEAATTTPQTAAALRPPWREKPAPQTTEGRRSTAPPATPDRAG
jgi:hypothetical protein